MSARVDSWRLLMPIFMVVVLFCNAGCGNDGKLKIYPVTGQVLYNKQPLKGIDVAFHPVDPKNDTGYPPHAKTNEKGQFTLTTYELEDGAPAGDFQVALAFAVEVAGGDEGSDQTKRILFQVPAKYHRKETSGITVKIKPEANTLEPFTLEGPPLAKGKR
jgi:hypothetical protein